MNDISIPASVFSSRSLSSLDVKWLQQGIDELWKQARAGESYLLIDTGVMSDRSVMFPEQANIIEVLTDGWTGSIDDTKINFVVLYLSSTTQLVPFLHYTNWCVVSDAFIFIPPRLGILSLKQFISINHGI